jgi:hypothetical protein
MPSPFPVHPARHAAGAALLAEVERLHAAVREWSGHLPVNAPYIDLMFAFGFAMLRDPVRARKPVAQARVAELPVPTGKAAKDYNPVTAAVARDFLVKAFEYRVEQAIAGKPHAGSLSVALAGPLGEIAEMAGSGPVNNPHKVAEYVITRAREQFRTLEPDERLDPYAEWTKLGDDLRTDLAGLHTIADPEQLRDRIRRLDEHAVTVKPRSAGWFGSFRRTRPEPSPSETRLLVLHEALPLAPRVGEAFTAVLLELVPAVLAGLGDGASTPGLPDAPRRVRELLEHALSLAARLGRGDLVRQFVEWSFRLTAGQPEASRFRLITAVGRQCLRSLKKLGLREETDRFLHRLQSEVLAGLHKNDASKPEVWGQILQTRLVLAAGQLMLGRDEAAVPILDEARSGLLGPTGTKLDSGDYTQLARAYVAAAAEGPAGAGLARIAELFREMNRERITNTWATAAYYSRSHLNLVEEAVAAVCRTALEPALPPRERSVEP